MHDLGGRHGFGKIDVDEKEEPFHADWEARGWGISSSVAIPEGTIDWWRFVRENSLPVDYLSRPYLDSWLETDMVTMIEAGMCTVSELASGKSETGTGESPDPVSLAEVLAIDRGSDTRFDRPIDAPPLFAVGDTVSTKQQAHTGHTRLPAYARGHGGTIIAHHGAHLFPDAGAEGREVAMHLYTVSFKASDLWPEVNESADVVMLDLWESYLDAQS